MPKHQGLFAQIAVQIFVARAHCQAIRLPKNGSYDYAQREMQIAHHPFDDSRLLKILSSKNGYVRLHGVEELGHHGGDAPEVGRAGGSFHSAGELFLDYESAEGAVSIARIHLLVAGSKDYIDTRGAAKAQIASSIPGR